MSRLSFAMVVLALMAVANVCSAAADSCVPPAEFVDVPHPAVAPVDRLVSHTEEIVIDRPLTQVLSAVDKPLRDVVHKSSGLPGVAGDYVLTKGEFGAPGSRRVVCLTDGSTVEEQSLDRERNESSFRFRYVVWNYTTEKARPIEYGLGDFRYTASPDGTSTRIVWTYSFQLNRHRFPGYLGSVGDFLFRISFLDRPYAEMMRNTLNGYKTAAENEKPQPIIQGSARR